MAYQKLLLDTNIILDYIGRRGPHIKETELLMLTGRVGEFSLWVSASQMTDIVYILTNGGNKARVPKALEQLRLLCTFVNVYAVTAADVDKMLATTWSDPEDALLVDLALKMGADAIITRDDDFPSVDSIRVHDCPGFFKWLEDEKGLTYADIDF